MQAHEYWLLSSFAGQYRKGVASIYWGFGPLQRHRSQDHIALVETLQENPRLLVFACPEVRLAFSRYGEGIHPIAVVETSIEVSATFNKARRGEEYVEELRMDPEKVATVFFRLSQGYSEE